MNELFNEKSAANYLHFSVAALTRVVASWWWTSVLQGGAAGPVSAGGPSYLRRIQPFDQVAK